MTNVTEHIKQESAHANIRVVYQNTLVPLALRGLEKMFLADQSAFCEVARPDTSHKLTLSGISLRYTAMSLIGLTMQENLGRSINLPLDKISDRLFSWAADDISLGDRGLVLWALALRRDSRAERIAQGIIVQSNQLPRNHFSFNSMALGWLLAGLSVSIRDNIAGDELLNFASYIYSQLISNRNEKTGLFSLGSAVVRRNIFAARLNSRLGSFASQVYPIIGLAYFAKIRNCPESLRIAENCADVLCRLQGPLGQWWWIYAVRTAQPVIKYPVYSVHQDAMGPMALLAVLRAGSTAVNYTPAIEKSLAWLDVHPELSEAQLIDGEISVIWRAIQRDEPSRTGGFGLGWRQRLRMNCAAWLGGVDNRDFREGFICYECRPYHLGWVLLADALAAALGDLKK